jgi:pyruvate ferredoxin oxidoreductase delta subunit
MKLMIEKDEEYETMHWVVTHGRGVIHTGSMGLFSRILSMSGVLSGRESYYYMRYDDSPERDNIPMIFYTVFGNPDIDVILREEVEPIGDVFDAVVIYDSSILLHQTSQRALVMDGAKKSSALVVNTSLSAEKILDVVKKHSLAEDWDGKIVTIRATSLAKEYNADMSYALLGALLKGWDLIKLEDLLSALDSLDLSNNAELAEEAYERARVLKVSVRADELELARVRMERKGKAPEYRGRYWDKEIYREYQKAASEAISYSERIEAMPRWEAIAPGLINFGPEPGKRNIGFKTSFSRYLRPHIDFEKCKDCKLCHLYCPDGAVDFNPIKIDYDYCQGCGICERICPVKAISMATEMKALEGIDEEEFIRAEEALREYGY